MSGDFETISLLHDKYTEDETVKKKAEEIIHFLRYEKVEGLWLG